jgi:transposase
MASDGFASTRIAEEVQISAATVTRWRERFSQVGLKEFSSVRPGRGRKPSISREKVEEIVRLTLHETRVSSCLYRRGPHGSGRSGSISKARPDRCSTPATQSRC